MEENDIQLLRLIDMQTSRTKYSVVLSFIAVPSLHLVAPDAPAAALEGLPARARGLRVARIAVRLADPLAESPGESLSRVRMWQARIPRPVLQKEIWTEAGMARTDYFWPEAVAAPHPVAEFDGDAKYHREVSGHAVEETVLAERRRERALWRLGFPMARWTWADAWDNSGARTLAERARGAGCPRGAAVTAELAKGASPLEAAVTAKEVVSSSIRHGLRGNMPFLYVYQGEYRQD